MMQFISENTWGKRKENIFRRGSWLLHHAKLNLFLKNKPVFSSENIHVLILRLMYWLYSDIVNDDVSSTSSQIVEQIEVIQEVLLPGISKLTYH